jgi:hypothetical protein
MTNLVPPVLQCWQQPKLQQVVLYKLQQLVPQLQLLKVLLACRPEYGRDQRLDGVGNGNPRTMAMAHCLQAPPVLLQVVVALQHRVGIGSGRKSILVLQQMEETQMIL